MAISTTAREGSWKRSPAAVALPGPSAVRQASSASSSSAAAMEFCSRGSTPAAVAPATQAAPAKPPKLQPACSEDMIGRSSRPSMAEPWAFIDTSIAAPAAPKTSSASGRRYGSGAGSGSGTARQQSVPPSRTARALPSRTTAWPITGRATITPIDIVSRISPSVLLARSKRSCTNGIWATQTPIAAPLTTNTPVVAARGLTHYGLSGAARGGGTAAHPLRGGGDLGALGRELLLLALRADLDDVPGQLRRFHRADHPGRRVDLPPAQAVHRRARERVVVVVPGLAEGERREPEDVGRVVVDVEAAGAEEVADRVDRPGDVVQQEDAHRAAPQRAGDGARQRPLDRPAHGGRERDSDRDPDREQGVDDAEAPVLDEVAGVLVVRGLALAVEQPAHVRVPEALQRAREPAPVTVRRVRVAVLVGERVVLAVVGDPRDDRALHRHRAEDRPRVLDGPVGGEGAVGEHAVEADRDPQSRGDVHHAQQRQVAPVDPRVPEQHDGHEDREQGHHDPREVGHPVRERHVYVLPANRTWFLARSAAIDRRFS